MVVHDALRVVGYYGLAPTAVVATAMPRRIRTGQPPDPIPACSSASSRPTPPTPRALAGARLIGGHAIDPRGRRFLAPPLLSPFLPSKDDPGTLPLAARHRGIAPSRGQR
jgi:hypothetical protein